MCIRDRPLYVRYSESTLADLVPSFPTARDFGHARDRCRAHCVHVCRELAYSGTALRGATAVR
eukprot:3508387-Alexandrium_andersonii.AAC.1